MPFQTKELVVAKVTSDGLPRRNPSFIMTVAERE
jgi:hypothetical protein